MKNKIIGKNKNKNSKKNKIKIILIISFIFLLDLNLKVKMPLLNIDTLISKLIENIGIRKPKYILFFDFLPNKYCNDYNSYLIFQNYQERKKTDAYYVINIESDLYNFLSLKNKTNNLILYNQTGSNSWNTLYPYLLDSKIMVHSYILPDFVKLVNNVNYIKYLKINHGIRYFKNRELNELRIMDIGKRNTIISSPYEYNIYKNNFKFLNKEIHKAGLPRYDRFHKIRKNKDEKDCILIFFTYRSYNESYYDKSLMKKNIQILLEDKILLSFLKNRNIDLIYIQHHFDILRNRTFEFNNFTYVKYKKQSFLKHYIEQCSLLVTDFSSISFDFIFQNKPALFYLIDYYETFEYFEKDILKKFPKPLFLKKNIFYYKTALIDKILYYVNKQFKIEDYLKKEYEKVFYYKNNITQRVVKIIDNIIKKEN